MNGSMAVDVSRALRARHMAPCEAAARRWPREIGAGIRARRADGQTEQKNLAERGTNFANGGVLFVASRWLLTT